MRTSKDRFSSHVSLFRGKDGGIHNGKTYTYESAKALYDIVVIEGYKLVRTNMGKLSPFICDWKPHHYKIQSHFDL